ncbi:MAG: NADPH-dependent F420 reductase [Nitrososphaerales archaeon]
MKIAILGGTGNLGRGLALRWAKSHDVIIGSRDEKKAKEFANDYSKVAKKYYKDEMKGSIIGYNNFNAMKASEVAVLSIPHEVLIDFIQFLKPFVTSDKIIISPVVPFDKDGECYKYMPFTIKDPQNPSLIIEASAAEVISLELGLKRIVSTFHTMPAKKLCNLSLNLDCDALIASDDIEAVKLISELISQIPNLRPIYAGPLKVSRLLEALTPLLMNLSLCHKNIKEPSIKIV